MPESESDSVPNDTVIDSTAARNTAIAQESIAIDVAQTSGSPPDDEQLISMLRSLSRKPSMGYSMGGSYRRQSFIAAGTSRSAFLPGLQGTEQGYLTKDEEQDVRDDERSLLRDNNLLPPKHPRRSSTASTKSKANASLSKVKSGGYADNESTIESGDEESLPTGQAPTETTSLLQAGDPTLPYGGQDSPDQIDKKWDEAVSAGNVKTTWQREAKVLGRYSRSLILTYFLQYSLTVCSVFAIGHLGTIELGAVSLASMTTNITGYAVLQGLATSLDTLCAQAYGSGNKKLVGVQAQRMILFLYVVLVPIGIVWLAGGRILSKIVPDPHTAELAGLYLKVALAGAPGYATFEAMKRYAQAQGLFTANLYVLLVLAPLNAFLHWLFVWHLGLGFVGAPLSVAIVETLMPFSLGLYLYFVAGRECWGGFSSQALKNWWPMIRLALPGLVMVLAEYLAFEILTFGASWISTSHLAAQSVCSTVLILLYNIPFPVSVASSTRIANLIGAQLPDAAKTSAKAALVISAGIGIFNALILSTCRAYIPRLFTKDQAVIDIVANLMPLLASFQLFDALATSCNGILRGIGRQEVGGYVSLAAYYGIAMPISFGTGFGLKWGLLGLWAGPAIAQLL